MKDRGFICSLFFLHYTPQSAIYHAIHHAITTTFPAKTSFLLSQLHLSYVTVIQTDRKDEAAKNMMMCNKKVKVKEKCDVLPRKMYCSKEKQVKWYNYNKATFSKKPEKRVVGSLIFTQLYKSM